MLSVSVNNLEKEHDPMQGPQGWKKYFPEWVSPYIVSQDLDRCSSLPPPPLEGQTRLFLKKIPLLLRTEETHKCFPYNPGVLGFGEKTNFAFF